MINQPKPPRCVGCPVPPSVVLRRNCDGPRPVDLSRYRYKVKALLEDGTVIVAGIEGGEFSSAQVMVASGYEASDSDSGLGCTNQRLRNQLGLSTLHSILRADDEAA